jgi:hypothetical protein
MEQRSFLKALCSIMLVVAVAIVIAACGSSPGAGGGESLDAVVAQAARRMEERLPGGTKVAIVSVASPSTAFSSYVIDSLEAALVDKGTVTVVDRANLERIREEQGLQLSGEVSDESAKAIGQLLGAGAIVTGSLLNIGNSYRLTLKAINIESAEVVVSYPADIANDERVQALLASGGGSVAASGRPAAAVSNTPAAPATVYKIGDTGPAGGIVFYDKGNTSGGWRYLEAAPASTEGKLKWHTSNNTVGGTKTDVGAGKENTRILAGSLSQGVPEAALMCVELNYGGFSDWFLPSKDELNSMYIYLKRRGLGDFSGDLYWSSSEPTNLNAWAQSFSDGSQTLAMKFYTISVRAVRAF